MKRSGIITTIYIVDDDPVYTNSLKKSIEKPHKYNIQTFTTGERFIDYLTTIKFKSNEIHMVFLGYHFYDTEGNHTLMNGIEILEGVKTISPDIEVVMLYAGDESRYGAHARESGAYDFIPKTDTIFLRINNIIMRIISEKKLTFSKRAYLRSVRVVLIYFIIATLVFMAYMLFSQLK